MNIDQSRILIIATDGFEQSELMDPRARLMDLGAEVVLASIKTEPIRGEKHGEPGSMITPDISIADARADDYDALLLPGGVGNPDKMRVEDKAIALIQAFDKAGKPIAAICHAAWLLIEAELVAGRKVTSWPSVRTDLVNAGGEVVDEEVVIDGNLITSRKPADIPAFTDALVNALESLDTRRQAA